MAAALPPAFSHSHSHSHSRQTFAPSSNLLDRARPLRASPDSDALASSDEDDHDRRPSALQSSTARRPSWKLDSQPRPRQGSFIGSQLSPSSVGPNPLAQDASAAWSAAGMSRGSFSQGTFWGGGIWNSDGKPQDTMQSPTSVTSPGYAPKTESGVPFPIPLQPNPKAYRSQSYSVGQPDPELSLSPGPTAQGGRIRPGQHRRPSRPSLLNDTDALGRVQETENNQEAPFRNRLGSSSHQNPYPPGTLQPDHQLRNRTSLGGLSAASGYSAGKSAFTGAHRYLSSEPQEVDYAIEETDDLNELQSLGQRGMYERRYSEATDNRYPMHSEARLDAKRGPWHTSLGFGPDEGSQSRRHSFADVPLRHGSIGSGGSVGSGDHQLGLGLTGRGVQQRYNDQRSPIEAAYYGVDAYKLHETQNLAPHYMHANTRLNTPPTRSMYASPHANMQQPRANQLLYIVTFKACRAEVFYIQDGTGLQVKPGDLVIVEADRGTDLGTVAQTEVTWTQAKEWKEFYAHEHYKWLMVFSRQGASGPAPSQNSMQSISGSMPPSAVGGMGPAGPGMMPDPSSSEIKPKMIKRVAQPHEIQMLRDKEGNEAKAKRVCQQKVAEHHLNMEILDAEYQMDWKKLTFYYFADSYINFNSLVTDLFKIYKTRIWMSALNPASFAHPSASLQAPTGLGPGALGIGRDLPAEYRQEYSLGLLQDPNSFTFPSLNG